jgi:hypothetical protein
MNTPKEQLFDNPAFEAVFKQAVIDDFNREVEEVFASEAPDITPSARHERRMKALFAKERRRKRIRRVAAGARRFSTVAAVLVIALNLALICVPAVRAAIGAVFVDWFDTHTKFTGGDAPDTVKRWEPTMLPDGFTETERYDFDEEMVSFITYADANGEVLRFKRIPTSGSISVNNEGVTYGQVSDGGIVYHTFDAVSSDIVSSVVWDSDGYLFCINGRLPIEELLAVARSVKEV